MTANKRFKRLVRARADKTGESYTAALRHFARPPEGSTTVATTFEPARLDDITWDEVEHLTIVPFIQNDGRLVLVDADGHLSLPEGPVLEEEDPYLDTGLRVLLETAGFRLQQTYVLARAGSSVALWCEGYRYDGTRPHRAATWWVGEAAEGAARLRAQGEGRLARLVEVADEARRTLSDDEYFEGTGHLLEAAYLDPRNETPRQGSGFGGSEADWYAGRHHLSDAVDHDGTFVDIGCANGHLLETLVPWCAERGHHIEPFGVDLSAALVAEAAERLPAWADRFAVGNALTWVPGDGRRFDYVHVLLELVPAARRGDLVTHLVEEVAASGGRVIVSHYVPRERSDQHPRVLLEDLGFTVAGTTEPAEGARVVSPSAWIDV